MGLTNKIIKYEKYRLYVYEAKMEFTFDSSVFNVKEHINGSEGQVPPTLAANLYLPPICP